MITSPTLLIKNIDLFIIHAPNIDPRTNDTFTKLVPNAKNILPLHVLELGHGPDIVNEKHDWRMDYQGILDNYSNGYYGASQGRAKFTPMIWGESLLL